MKHNYFALNLHLALECGGWSRNAFRAVLKSQTVIRNVNVKHYHGNCVIFHSQTFSYLNTNFGTYLVAKCGPAQENSGTMTVMVFCSEYTFDRFFFLHLRSKICFFFLTSPLCCSSIFCYFILIYWTLHFFIEMSKKLRCKRQFSMQDVSEVSEELHT